MQAKLKSLKKAFSIIVILLLLQQSNLSAQIKLEYGFMYGPSNFLGDLGGNAGKGGPVLKDNMISLTRFMSGVYVGFSPFEFLNFKISASIGKVDGADSLIAGNGGLEEARKARNQHFKSSIKEAYLSAEIYPTALLEYDANDVIYKVRPYVLFGVGVFHFKPQAQYVKNDGSKEWTDLKPLRTEGQGMPNYPDRKEYSLTQINIPYGFGVKYFVTQDFAVSFEIVNRKTFTDYIDDVSTGYIANEDFYAYFGQNTDLAAKAVQMANKSAFANGGNYRPGFEVGAKRGTATNNDAYYSTSVKVNLRLETISKTREKRARGVGSIRCPKI
jgi:hypothetical protein